MFLSDKRTMVKGLVLAAALLGTSTAFAAGGEGFVAGSAPSERPAGAPKITTFKMSAAQKKDFFRGVSKPYPPSLLFVRNQGGWYTPFMHAGMPGKYDLRGWSR